MNSFLTKAVSFASLFTATIVTSITSIAPNVNAQVETSPAPTTQQNQTAPAQIKKQQYNKAPTKGKNIVQTAQATPSLSNLVDGVVQAGLAETLSSKGPFTVFAPDNDAFKNSPKPTKENLKDILTHHVVMGRLSAEKLRNGQILKTGNGQSIKVIKNRSGVKLKSSSGNVVTVKTANIKTSNGIVHIIDRVLIPSKH